jgi:HPt (histidine-containing phosphotransfer) domain-containing protein
MHLDKGSLAQYLGNDESMIRRFISLFLTESPNIVNQIDEGIQNNNYPVVANGAHTLKGQLKYFGLPEQVALLQQIEDNAEKGTEGPKIGEQWHVFSQDFSEIYQQIRRIDSI